MLNLFWIQHWQWFNSSDMKRKLCEWQICLVIFLNVIGNSFCAVIDLKFCFTQLYKLNFFRRWPRNNCWIPWIWWEVPALLNSKIFLQVLLVELVLFLQKNGFVVEERKEKFVTLNCDCISISCQRILVFALTLTVIM